MRRTVLLMLLSLAALTQCTTPARRQVHFDADFEGGALGPVKLLDQAVITLAPGQKLPVLSYQVGGKFDPENPVDTSLSPSANWYYFRMTGVRGKQICLYLPDNGVPRTSCSYDGVNWHHLPLNESEPDHLVKRFEHDTVFLALYVPYTYSYLQERLADWSRRPGVQLDTIGYSFEGRPLQLLHITDPTVPDARKKRLWIHGRQHPSESPASYLVDGLVDYLTSDTPEGRSLRQQIDAYVLPFANPDGVARGLSRSNALGVNQEINFGRSDDSTVVEVRAIKQAFSRLTAERPFDVVINSHSQLAEYATVWMHRGTSTSPLYLSKEWAFAGLLCSFNPCLRPEDMNFADIAPRYAEGWFWEHAREQTLALTLETTYNCYQQDRDGLWADNDNIRAFGRRTLQAIAEYLGLSLPGRYLVETPQRMPAGWEPVRAEENSYLGSGAWKATRSGATVQYALEQLPAGHYTVYRYVPGHCIEPQERIGLQDPDTGEWADTGIHGWVFAGEIRQARTGGFRYTYTAREAGDFADALLLVRCDESL